MKWPMTSYKLSDFDLVGYRASVAEQAAHCPACWWLARSERYLLDAADERTIAGLDEGVGPSNRVLQSPTSLLDELWP